MVAEYEHVPEREKCIWTIKEIILAMWNMLPFKNIPTKMIIEMVTGSAMLLNIFLTTDGISTTISQRNLFTGLHINYKNYFRIEFGSYTQKYEEYYNGMVSWTIGASTIQSTGNTTGGHCLFILINRRFFHHHR